LISGYTIGGFGHILLVIAIFVVLVRVIQGRKPFQKAVDKAGEVAGSVKGVKSVKNNLNVKK
jgi:hypothetical protein